MRRDGERGAALLTVLLLVAVISVMAATTLEKLRVSTRLASNVGSIEQGRALAMAAETMATTKVTDLLSRDPSRVTLAGGWSDRPYALPLPGGIATARVRDGGNCFNLNSLVTKSENTPAVYTFSQPAMDEFARLMRLLSISGQPQSIAAAAADWIDSDNTALPSGAEDGDYAGGATPYRTANAPMADVSELRAVAGVTPDVYARLRPWLCALPETRLSTINVNTLSPEQAPLLAMLLPDTLGVEGARSALLKRPPQGWSNYSDFEKTLTLGGIVFDPAARAQASVTSRWFALRIDVTFGAITIEEHGLIDATALPAQLVSRQWGEQT